MKQKSGPDKAPAEQVLKNIRRQTRRPPPGDRRRLAWRARSGTGPTLTGLGHGCAPLSETRGVVRLLIAFAFGIQEHFAGSRIFPNDFIATRPFRPSPLTGVRYQPLPDEVLDCGLNCELYLSRVCRPVFSCHTNFPT